jgi:putative ABC transport system substrate-binding protein
LASAQPAGKNPSRQFLGAARRPEYAPHVAAAMRLGLKDHGHVEGKNVTLEFRWADGHTIGCQRWRRELVRLKVDLIVTQGTPAALIAKQATTTIPIVMAIVRQPRGNRES